jgi:hypothetical protein
VHLAREISNTNAPSRLRCCTLSSRHRSRAERFQRESDGGEPGIRTLGVYDSEVSTNISGFTMPFVEGESLRDRLNRQGRLTIPDAVRIARGGAGAGLRIATAWCIATSSPKHSPDRRAGDGRRLRHARAMQAAVSR